MHKLISLLGSDVVLELAIAVGLWLLMLYLFR